MAIIATNYYIYVQQQHRLKSKQFCPKRQVKLISPSDSCILQRVVNPRDQTRYKKRPGLTPLMSYSESKVTAGDSTVHQTASCREWPRATPWSVPTYGRIFIQPAEIFIAYKLEGWSYYITQRQVYKKYQFFILIWRWWWSLSCTECLLDREKTRVSTKGYPHWFIKRFHTILFCVVMQDVIKTWY